MMKQAVPDFDDFDLTASTHSVLYLSGASIDLFESATGYGKATGDGIRAA